MIVTRRRRWGAIVLGCLFLLAVPMPGEAQTTNGGVAIGPSSLVATPLAPNLPYFAVPASPDPETIFGGKGDFRHRVRDRGIGFVVDLRNEFSGNVAGGTARTAAMVSQLGVESDIDWQKLAGLKGFSTHAVLINLSGGQTNRGFGDNLVRSQDLLVTNGGDVAVHLSYAYGEETFAHGRLDLAAGRFPVGLDFASSPLYCQFMSKGFCGNPRAFSVALSGFTIAPISSWGARLRIRPTRTLYLQFGLFSYENGTNQLKFYRSGFKFDASDIVGLEFPLEAGWEPSFGRTDLAGHYRAGFTYNDAPRPDLYTAVTGAPIATSGKPALIRHGASQWWVLFDQMLVRRGAGLNNGLVLFGGFVGGTRNVDLIDRNAFIGLVDRGLLSGRPRDAAGLAFTYVGISPQQTATEELDILARKRLPSGVTGIRTHEQVLEAFYNVHLFTGFNFQPDVQYFMRPNGQGNIPDAAVLGFKTRITF